MVRAIPDRDREQYCDVGSSLLIKIVVCSSLLLAIFHLHLRSRFENQSLPVISAAGGGANQPATVFSSPINPTLLRASDGSLPLMKIKTAEYLPLLEAILDNVITASAAQLNVSLHRFGIDLARANAVLIQQLDQAVTLISTVGKTPRIEHHLDEVRVHADLAPAAEANH